MKKLGTETAFNVSDEACELVSNGKKIYPFHLGDMNIRTPSRIIEATKKAMDRGKTGYCPSAGIPDLREAVAKEIGETRGLNLAKENVSVQPGGKPVIAKFILAFMDPGDEVLYPNPGYPIYESQILFHGGIAKPYCFRAKEDGFALDLESIEKSITPKTKLLTFNNYQNPIGAEAGEEEMRRLADICVKHDLLVLSDEAYFDITYSGERKSIASYPGMFERTLILYTFSKAFAMTGWRLGAAIGPEWMVKEITRLNVNDESCSNHFIQWGALEALKHCKEDMKKIVDTLRERRDVACEILNRIKGVKVVKPNSTFYLFPDITEAMRNLGFKDVEEFRKFILDTTGVSFCTRKHFGVPTDGEDREYIRLAYSGIGVEDIKEGLLRFKETVENPKIVKKWREVKK
ncbi:MAG: aminotransferase class I/II-fold pyridoxal phosphate-dependent enzyme [Candidatus Aenigmatarchaeota archaeon]|nr:MAG: aminotransferase class I/II-fold pyridoxal phosphate-dependent enzyme [Candidatus Aenigmarchaeota archaeon]